jgi:hypothetical protein
MKKMTILTLLIFLFLQVKAPAYKALFIERAEAINYYDALIKALTWVESRNDNYALNVSEQAYGAFQIRPIRIEHYNRLTGSHYLPWDCFDYEISRKVFLYFAHNQDYEMASRNWNGKGRKTIQYWNSVKARLKRISNR